MKTKLVFFSLLKLLFLLFNLSFISSSSPKFSTLVSKYLSNLAFNAAYLSHKQLISLLDSLAKDFPHKLKLGSIGNSFMNNTMPLVEFRAKKEAKNAIFFTGMHHGREPVSMMMNVYLMLYLLSVDNEIFEKVMENVSVYFVPCVNVDGFKMNSEGYERGEKINSLMIRKNRNSHSFSCKKSEDLGVDLNRNYGYNFALDNEGSSNKPCDEDYRGPFAFSEPETRNIKNFVEAHPEIKIVINYHSYGNLVITPFTSLKAKESDKLMSKIFSSHLPFYTEFKTEANYPPNFSFGNADATIQYLSNGDATDWLMGDKNILNFSPELGNGLKNSDRFYPNKKVTFEILQKNLESGMYAIMKSGYFLKGKFVKGAYFLCGRGTKSSVKNMGDRRNLENLGEICGEKQVLVNIMWSVVNEGKGKFEDVIELRVKNQNPKETKILNYCYQINNNNNIRCDKLKEKTDIEIKEKLLLGSRESIQMQANFIIDKNIIKSNDFIEPLFTVENTHKDNFVSYSEKNEKLYWKFILPEVNFYSSNFTVENKVKVPEFIFDMSSNQFTIFLVSSVIILMILFLLVYFFYCKNTFNSSNYIMNETLGLKKFDDEIQNNEINSFKVINSNNTIVLDNETYNENNEQSSNDIKDINEKNIENSGFKGIKIELQNKDNY